jgi:hypothetical protein
MYQRLSDEDEQKLLDLFRLNKLLYIQTDYFYSNKDKSEQTWNDIAQQLNTTVHRFGKVAKKKFGDYVLQSSVHL